MFWVFVAKNFVFFGVGEMWINENLTKHFPCKLISERLCIGRKRICPREPLSQTPLAEFGGRGGVGDSIFFYLYTVPLVHYFEIF